MGMYCFAIQNGTYLIHTVQMSRMHGVIDIIQSVTELPGKHGYAIIIKRGAFKKAKSKCNRLYHILLSKVQTYAMDMVTVLINDSNLLSAILTHRIAMCPLKQSAIKQINVNSPMRISFMGEGYIVTGQCSEVPFAANNIKLCYIKDKASKVILDCHIAKGDATVHARFNPICHLAICNLTSDQVAFKFTMNGQYTIEELEANIISLYSSSDLIVSENIPAVETIRYPEDLQNIIPRSAIAMPYGVMNKGAFGCGQTYKDMKPTSSISEGSSPHVEMVKSRPKMAVEKGARRLRHRQVQNVAEESSIDVEAAARVGGSRLGTATVRPKHLPRVASLASQGMKDPECTPPFENQLPKFLTDSTRLASVDSDAETDLDITPPLL